MLSTEVEGRVVVVLGSTVVEECCGWTVGVDLSGCDGLIGDEIWRTKTKKTNALIEDQLFT